MSKEVHDLTVELLAETEKAWKLSDDGEREAWFPKSQCELEKNKDGKTYTLTAPTWLLDQKEWL